MTSNTEGWSVLAKENPSMKSLCMMEDLPRERFMGLGADASSNSLNSESVSGAGATAAMLEITSVCGVISYW